MIAAAVVLPRRRPVGHNESTTVHASAGVMTKARRLLADGAVLVELADCEGLLFTVQGDHGRYAVTRRRGGWSCTCEHRGRCSHLTAVALITGGLR